MKSLVFLYIATTLAAFGQTSNATVDPDEPTVTWTSPSSELDQQLPKFVIFTGEYRSRFEGYSGGGFAPNSSDDYLLSRLQLNLLLRPYRGVKLFAQGMDARVFDKSPAVPPYQDTFNLRQAYLQVGDFDTSVYGVRAGRQELMYGDQRLIGNSPWLNTERVFDALRLSGHYKSFRLDVFGASVVNPMASGLWDHHTQGNNIYGAYGNIDRVAPWLTIQPYGFWRLQHGLINEEGVVSKLNEKVGGIRLVGTAPLAFDYTSEMVREFGSLGTDKIQSWAAHWEVGRTFNARFSPHAYAEFNYAGGDEYPKDGIRGTFDQLYPTGHDKYGFADQVGWRNMKNERGVVETKLRSNVTGNLEYNNWYLASATDALYNAAGVAVVRDHAGNDGTHIGQEIDVNSTWTIVKAFTVGAGFGHIFPGDFLKHATQGNPYNYPFVMATWKF